MQAQRMLQRQNRSDLSDHDIDAAVAPGAAGMEVKKARKQAGTSMEAAAACTLNLDEGDGAPDALATVYVHSPPLLLRVMHSQLTWAWVNVRCLAQLAENWQTESAAT